ncbi:hypothetical protein [Neochlamydia sp. AcF95]|uniref:hypothetical protein n=1 Tax=Neochlamydia sp. AcF95 TaxID=2795734 RepID=UPI001BC9B720|nr:hypothetical protein [Neochlamydia sp. AcF95]MBS4170006.1 hypothetical protein [Neochlamydia sp. AcF95]
MNVNPDNRCPKNNLDQFSPKDNFPSISAVQADNRALVQPTHATAMKVFEENFALFNHYHQIAIKVRDDITAIEYSELVKKAENALLHIRHVVANHPDLTKQRSLQEMEAEFDELCINMPLGASVLLQRDIDKLHKISTIPSNKTYLSGDIEYNEPQVPLCGLIGYFERFKELHGYASISICMKTGEYYGIPINKMATLIGFRNQSSSSSIFPSLLPSRFKTSNEEKIYQQLNELRILINNKINEWGYAGFTIFHTDEVKHNLKKVPSIEEWGCQIVLYHTKQGEENNIPNEECLHLESSSRSQEKKINNFNQITRKKIGVQAQPKDFHSLKNIKKNSRLKVFFKRFISYPLKTVSKFISLWCRNAYVRIRYLKAKLFN